uniref:RRM domain-containing protein n=1 Tax=Salix viminalis TaxID=40686 RepID=A0A6N2LYC4_SALVM
MAKTGKTKKLKTAKKPETTTKQKPLKKPKLKIRKTKPPPPDSADLSTLLEPYTKDQLIDLITTSAINNPTLYSLIHQHADRDVTHRNVFVHGFSWDTTRQDLESAFAPFGEIEECNVVIDKATGKAKGYGFVLFKSRKAAISALKETKRMVNDRMASCQLASVGSANATSAAKGKELDGGVRKIFVSNVGMGTDKEKLRAFFEKFGEIENGPIGFDKETGRSRGYALFVYKTVEGAIKALEEPHKIFEGQQLRCSVATEGKQKTIQNVPQGMQQVVQQQRQQQQQQQGHQHPQGQFLAAAQNLALFGQHPGFNPFYSALLGNTGVGGGMLSPVIGQSVVPTATSQVRGLGAGSQSTLEAYRAAQVLQQVYSSTTQFGQTGMGRGQGADGSFAGYPKYMWYGLSKLDFSVAVCLFILLILYFSACSSCWYHHNIDFLSRLEMSNIWSESCRVCM